VLLNFSCHHFADWRRAFRTREFQPGNETILNGLVTREVISTIFANVELPGGFAIRVEAEAEPCGCAMIDLDQ
jgi:hypothetical protein